MSKKLDVIERLIEVSDKCMSICYRKASCNCRQNVTDLLKPTLALLKKAGEVIDDDLEERPRRHSLGRLHASIKAHLKSFRA